MLGHHNNAVAFCSTTWTQVLLKPAWHVVAKVFLCMCKCWKRHGHFVAKVMSPSVQLLKSKGKILLCQGCWNKWAKAIFGKSGVRQPHSIALGLRIFLVTVNRIGVTTSALKFERVYVCVYIYMQDLFFYFFYISIFNYIYILTYSNRFLYMAVSGRCTGTPYSCKGKFHAMRRHFGNHTHATNMWDIWGGSSKCKMCKVPIPHPCPDPYPFEEIEFIWDHLCNSFIPYVWIIA